jgi:hypothetical protein
MQDAATKMAEKYTKLKADTEGVLSDIKTLPLGLNDTALNQAKGILQYATQRTHATVELAYDVKDKNTRFTYSEILSFIDLFNTKKTDILVLSANLIRIAPPKPDPAKPTPTTPAAATTRTYTSNLPNKKLKVKAYKQWLQQELQKLASADNDDDIILS